MKKTHGFTLLEVLLATVIVSVGMLTAASLQLKALRQNNSNFVRSQAIILAYDMADRIRANKIGAANYDGVDIIKLAENEVFAPQCGNGSSCDCDGDAGSAPVSCSIQQLAQWDIDTWEKDIKDISIIPLGGSGSIRCNVTCSVVVKWDELNPKPDPTATDAEFTIEKSVTLGFKL